LCSWNLTFFYFADGCIAPGAGAAGTVPFDANAALTTAASGPIIFTFVVIIAAAVTAIALLAAGGSPQSARSIPDTYRLFCDARNRNSLWFLCRLCRCPPFAFFVLKVVLKSGTVSRPREA
jgi:hypothetical protein